MTRVTTQQPFNLRTEVRGYSDLKRLTVTYAFVLLASDHVLHDKYVTEETVFCFCTQQRGKAKEENFVQRFRERMLEEERLRNPLAQGLPYTTDEPEVCQLRLL